MGRVRNSNGTFKSVLETGGVQRIKELLAQGKSLDVISDEFGCSKTTIWRRLHAESIYLNPPVTLPKKELVNLYCQQNKSIREIANIFRCDASTVSRKLQQIGIAIRNHSQSMRLAGDQKKTARCLNHHSNWRGGRNHLPYSPSMRSAHFWIRQHYGKAHRCDLNSGHISTVYDWANISWQYKKERGDWLMLCHSCHYWFDHPEISQEQEKKLSPDTRFAYLEGRRRRNGKESD